MNIIKDENGYIDMIESQKRYLDIENLKKVYDLEKTTDTAVVLGMSGVVLAATSDLAYYQFPKPILYFIIGNVVKDFLDNIYPHGLTKSEIIELVHKSESYLECKDLYKNYIKDISDFFSSLNIKESLEISKMVNIQTEEGFFSVRPPVYKDYSHWHDEVIIDILGSRVTTGFSVCRHNSSFLKDILKESGHIACNLPVNVTSLNVLTNKKKINIIGIPKHMVTGIIENNEKYIYDPTSYIHGEFITESDPNYHSIKTDPNNIISATTLTKEQIYYMINNALNIGDVVFHQDGELTIDEFKNCQKSKNITDEEIEFILIKLLTIKKRYKYELDDFQEEHKNTVQKIKTLNRMIAPASDEKITTWKIK